MKECPGCAFLMPQDQALCDSCRSGERVSFPIDEVHGDEFVLSGPPPSMSPGGGSATMLLERPAPPVTGRPVRYRDPQRTRNAVKALVALVIVGGVLGVLGTMAMRGDGPLAPTFVSLGLADPPGVVVPSSWTTVSSTEGKFSALLPTGAVEHTKPVDEADPARGTYWGFEADLGEEGSIVVLSSDLGVGGALRSFDDAGFSALVDRFVAEGELGIETVRRDVLVGVGRVKDSVIAEPDGTAASRVRFLLADDRLHVLVTHGPDEYSRELDEAHARLIDRFDPES